MKTKNCFKKNISLLLAILTLVSCLTQGLVSFAIDIPDGYILQDGIFSDGETVTAEITTGKITLFEFIPTVTGVYQFEADPNLTCGFDTYGYLFDADLNELTSDDDSGSGYNFLIKHELIAGNTYYLGAKFVDSNQSGSFEVVLTCVEEYCDHIDANADEVCDVCSDTFNFIYEVLDDGTAKITDYTGTVTNLKIPSTIDGYAVTSIGNMAFYNNDNLQSVIIDGSLSFIGYSAFEECDNLQNVTIGKGVITIGYRAFYSCTSLQNIIIPDSVTSIGDLSFYECTNLKNATIPDSVLSIGYHAFYNTAIYNNESLWENDVLYINNHLIEVRNPLLSEYVIKNGTITIADSAFDFCTSLKIITIPNSVISICVAAFDSCTSLITVNYLGTKCQMEMVVIDSSNSPLINATINYALGDHIVDWVIGDEATCVTDGSYLQECIICGKILETEVITALGHDYSSEYTVDKQPTYTSVGSKSRHCSRCDAKTDVTAIEKLYYKSKTYTGLYKVDGVWRYVKNGELDNSFTGLCKYSGKWYYVEGGVKDSSFTGLCKRGKVWYYVKKGVVDFSYTGLAKRSGKWYYVNDGKVDFTYTGLCKYNGKWYYVEDGVVDKSYTGLCKYNSKWYYVKKGVVDFTYTGLCKRNGKWYYVDDGKVNFKYTGLCKYNKKWYYVDDGVVNFKYTGNVKYNGKKYKVVKGVKV